MNGALNPFASNPAALANRSYGRLVDDRLVTESEGKAPALVSEVHQALRAVLHDPDFPCVGAKSVVNQASYRFGLYQRLADPESTAGLAYDLFEFVQERPQIEGEFTSYIACFLEPKVRTPKRFEQLLWRQLRALHEADMAHFRWNDAVSADTDDPAFSFSLANNAFFVVGLSPASTRWARQFPWPTLVFNDHDQFELLREQERFDRLRDVIRERDSKLHGVANPMLGDYGSHSEARQYSGRQVGSDWRCPVHFDVEEDAKP
jgi:FPC/CPF motif-containing protein YcgG